MINVFEELVGRELNFIFESWGFGDDETAINQLFGAWLVVAPAKINFDGKS